MDRFFSSFPGRAVAPLVLIAAVLFGATPSRAAPPDGGLASPPIDVPGTLIIGGGGELPDSVYRLFMGLAGEDRARLVIVPTASERADDERAAQILADWKERGAASTVLLHTRSRKEADGEAFIRPLQDATGVWISGGDQARLADAYLGTATLREIKAVLERGGVVGGTSAGAAIMSTVMITGGRRRASLGVGFDLLPRSIVDQHFLSRNRPNRLIGALRRNPGFVGYGIDERTALIVRGRSALVLGESHVLIMMAASRDRPMWMEALGDGDRADLIALGRAAIARTRPPWPPPQFPRGGIENGMLIIGGGGPMPAEAIERFIEGAGGSEAPIVIIPTALPDPIGEVRAVRMFENAGAKNLKVAHARKPADVANPAFLRTLEEARGVWFTGGRQWRLVDAYMGTPAYDLFHRVLERGGVIGGSSAGATIQGDYLVRGNPLGNEDMMAEGYERGFGFLRGAAIDQHFTQRNRFADMTAVMEAFPQLLGIGIDEGTALAVAGDTMEVIGPNRVAVYRRDRPPAEDEKDYEVLMPGDRYDLRLRKKK